MNTMFTELSEKIEEYNDLVKKSEKPFSHLFLLTTGQKSNPEEIQLLESRIQTTIPERLRDFYLQVGNIKSESFNENNSIDVFSVKHLLEILASTDNSARAASLGILDMILFSWENDRYEIDELDAEMRTNLNRRYTCFGIFRTNDNLDSANYLYFDEEGRFGSIFYHQDDFEDLSYTYLKPLMKKSQATQSFEELMLDSFQTIIELKKEELGI